eukprot:5942776-Pyramimonas_sp.AAC.1
MCIRDSSLSLSLLSPLIGVWQFPELSRAAESNNWPPRPGTAELLRARLPAGETATGNWGPDRGELQRCACTNDARGRRPRAQTPARRSLS